MNEWRVSQRKPEVRIFWSRTPAAQKAVPSLTLYDCKRPQQVWASSVLAALWTGVWGFGVCWTQIWDARASSRRWGILEFCPVNWTQVAPSWSSAEAFSDLLKLFRRGTDGVYLFTTPMQAMASPASGYLAREWIPARSARAFREHASDLRRIFVFFCFSKSGFIKGTMKNWLMLVCFYFCRPSTRLKP